MSWRQWIDRIPRKYYPHIWFLSYLFVAVVLFLVIPPAYENYILAMVGVLGSGLLFSYLANSYWARDIEKRKKKYEMKVDLYSDLHNCLEGWILIREALILHELIEERLEGGGDANDNTIDESPISLSQYMGLLQEIKGILGGDFHTDIWQDLSDRSLMNLPFDEIESLSEVEIKARIKKAMDDSLLDLVRWFSEVFNRVNRNMSRLFVMDSQHVARKIHALGNLFLFTLDESGHAGVRDVIMSLEDDQRIRQLRAMTSDIYAHLLKDLDETL